MSTISTDERREVARRLRQAWVNVPDTNRVRHHLRVLYEVYEAVGFSDVESDAIDLFDRLADLIEPSRDPTERGIDSIYQWCFERLEGADGAEDELFCSIMSAIEDYRHPERVTATTARPVDRDALLALAEEMSLDGMDGRINSMTSYARRIREACGEVAE